MDGDSNGALVLSNFLFNTELTADMWLIIRDGKDSDCTLLHEPNVIELIISTDSSGFTTMGSVVGHDLGQVNLHTPQT